AEVLASGQLAAGAQTARFVEEFARYIGVPYGSATSNGTTALHAALAAVGVGPGDRVITTTFSFVATANAILFCGATPVFTDIDPVTYNMDPGSLAAALEAVPDAKAVLVVHLFGLPADMDAIGRLCAERGIPLVEDCAQAHGARYGQGQRRRRWGGERVGGGPRGGAAVSAPRAPRPVRPHGAGPRLPPHRPPARAGAGAAGPAGRVERAGAGKRPLSQ